MSTLLGKRLIKKKKITEEQLQTGLEHQRIHGGRIGNSLVALGFLTEEDLSAFFHMVPTVPQKVEETGLSFSFIVDLIIKHGLNMREFSISEMRARTRLPLSIVNEAIERLRKDHLAQVKAASQLSKLAYRFSLTDAGKREASEIQSVSRYVGPAPVPFDEYRNMVQMQTVQSILVDERSLNDAFSDIVVTEEILKRLGPAMSSGRAIFLYGPPGNGKTIIAETIGKALPGRIYMPYAVLVDGDIIAIYDGASHVAVEPELSADAVDQRWILVKRPVVMVGGEMTLKSLDLDFNPISKFYEAPLQMKANNGLFIVDDFGRQQIPPQSLLNRWIVPLERRTDFLTLSTGMKIEIPFDQLIVFSTNIEPRNLVDEAFLRRIRYKIKIDHPELNQYKRIFKRVCDSNSIAFSDDVFNDFIKHCYDEKNVKLCCCHCRDILDNIIDDAHYRGIKPEFTRETVLASWESYFVEL